MRQAKFSATINEDDLRRLRQGRKAGGMLSACLVLAMISIFSHVSLSPSALEFSSVSVDTRSVPQVLKLTNRGMSDFRPHNIRVEGSAAADFRVDRASCDTLRSGGTCMLLVEFQPHEPGDGERQARLVVETNDGNHLDAELSGKATTAAITVSPGSRLFDDVPPGTKSPDQEVVLTGVGGFHIHGVSLLGDTDQFGHGRSACQTSASNHLTTCKLAVWFAPQREGTWHAQLIINDDAVGAPHKVLLSGVSSVVPPPPAPPVLLPAILVEPMSLDFTSSERQQAVSVSNDGDAPLQIAVSLQGANPDRFEADAGSCPTSLAPHQRCSITVKYRPKFLAPRSNYSARLDLTHNAPNVTNPQNVALRWERVVAHDPKPQITVDPTALDFSDFYNADAMRTNSPEGNPQRDITIVNTGPVALQEVKVRVGHLDNGPFSHTDNCKQLAIGQKCTETVHFTPKQKSNYSDTLYIYEISEGILNQLATIDLTATIPSPPAPTKGTSPGAPKRTGTQTTQKSTKPQQPPDAIQ
jgi:hypothetical protein